ncbi:sensor histidine kinase [Streptomyces sp. NPDC092307]|uniref:sensor histidine kinase n=1 Tax=Streptomyces sp. NPDC092307 TaxID=3366013 RepID=UPI0038090630
MSPQRGLIRFRQGWAALNRAYSSPRHRRTRDASLAALVAVASCVALATVYRTGFFHSYLMSCLCALVAAASLMWRRTRPEVCVAVAFAATLASDEGTALVAAAYAMGRYGTRYRALTVTGVAVAYLATHSMAIGILPAPGWRVYSVALDFILPACFGHLIRRQSLLRDQLKVRLRQAEAAIDHAARFALLERRTRLAFDIHDTVGHHTTYLVMRAGAARLRPDLPPAAAQDFTDIQETALLVTRELRRVIAVLQESDAEEEHLGPHLRCHEFLEGLAGNMRAIGIDTSYSIDGVTRELGPKGESLLYRVSRESLTNAAKYAPCAPVRISLVFADETVILTVRNGPPLDGTPPRSRPYGSGGLGLAGLRTSVVAAGGDFRAGPLPAGGFEVRSVLPLPALTTGEVAA